jgi:predicted AlkP superfamily phosphohydrolase/phosphomutase
MLISRALGLVFAALLATTSCRSNEPKAKVVVLGFDGASWETIDPLIEKGKLPFLKQLKDESSWGPLTTFKPTKSPVIWTSIATGKTMLKHGILDFVFLEENDIQVPYSNSEKRVPSIWEILDSFDRRSVVVNWFVTYPPDKISGVMVSNRFRKALLLQGERRERLKDSVYPQELYDELKALIDNDYEAIRKDKELPDIPSAYEAIHEGKTHRDIAVLKDYWIYILQEALIENVSQRLYQTEEFDFFAAYFRLPDIVQHFVLEMMEPEEVEDVFARLRRNEFTEADRKAFLESASEVLEPFYRYMERIIQRFMTEGPYEDATFFVVSDHGFSLHRGGYDHYHLPDELPAPDGVFLAHGPGIKKGERVSANVYDIAPTILHLFDLPVGQDMDGKPLTAAFELEREIRYASYTQKTIETLKKVRDAEIEERTLEELRSLGYIK